MIQAKYYVANHSTPIINKVICVGLGLLLVFLLAFVHGIITAVNPIVYLGVIGTIGFGLVFGVGYRMLSKIAKVRDKKFILYSGVALILLGMYFSWGAYLAFQLEGMEGLFMTYLTSVGLITEFETVFFFIREMYRGGAWEIMKMPVNGIVLGLVWLLEIGIVVFMTFKVLNAYEIGPFNERFNTWYTKYRLFDEYQSLPNEKSFSEIEGGTVSDKIKNLNKGNANRFGRISLFYLENAGEAFLLYENVGRDSKGKREERTIIIDNLVIPKNEAKQMIPTFNAKKEFYFAY